MKNFENLSKENMVEKQEDYENLWKDLLRLFGTETARENFVELCAGYYKFLVKVKEQGFVDKKIAFKSEKGRAGLHNKIMETIYALMNQVKIDPKKEKKFRILAQRENVAKMIEDVFGYHSPKEKEKMESMSELGIFREGDFDE